MSNRIPALAEGSASSLILKKSTTPAKELQERKSIGSREMEMRLGAISLRLSVSCSRLPALQQSKRTLPRHFIKQLRRQSCGIAIMSRSISKPLYFSVLAGTFC